MSLLFYIIPIGVGIWFARTPHSVWVYADRRKRFWTVMMFVPFIDAIMVVVALFAVLPHLIAASRRLNGNPLRRTATAYR